MTTSRDAYAAVCRTLTAAGVDEPDAKSKVIVSQALGIDPGDVFLNRDIPMPAQQLIEAMAQRCAQGEPVEYVTGRAYFRYIELEVSPDVLIPRNETELVAEEAIERIKAKGCARVLDICTGSGCIAISLAAETDASVDACDISGAALALAKRNAKRNNAAVRFFLSDMLGAVQGTYDVIVCNPPYVSAQEYGALDKTVRDYEPKLALLAGDGLDFYRVLARDAGNHLNKNGALVLEVGAGQAADVSLLLADGGFTDIIIRKDYTGRDRIVSARKE